MSEIDAIIGRVNKRLKSEVLFYASRLVTHQRVTTGSLAFDLMLGGGWPLNGWNEVVGNESSGKTALALKTIAANQQINSKHRTLWVASEPYNKEWAATLGVDNDRVVVADTNVMEDAYQIVIDEGLDSQAFDAVVIDSYPALIPTDEKESVMDDATVALGARLTNKLMRKSPPAQRRKEDERDCLALLINQWRDRIVSFGDPRTTPGGKMKNFSALTRVEVAREEWIQDSSKRKVGQMIKCRTMKNKTAPPFRVGSTGFYFEDYSSFHKGDYDTVQEVWNIATTYDLIERHGAWYHFGDQKWNGKEPVLAALREDLDLQREVEAQVRFHVLGTPLPKKRRRTVRKQ